MRPLSLLLCLILISFLSIPRSALAETVVVSGANGADGADGAPGMPGGPGGDGHPATAIANTPFEANTAEAFGGDAGNGGRGGDASPGSGADGGDGGNAGRSGNAFAEAATTGNGFVRAIAIAGEDGWGGQGGSGSLSGSDGERGDFSPSGSAHAIASVEQFYDTGAPSPGLDGRAVAEAGRGNDAQATISGDATGTGSPDRIHRLDARAEAGQSGSPPGDAFAEASGATTHGSLIVIADASARGTIESGNATAIATGTHTGSGTLSVIATADVFDTSLDFGRDVGFGTVRAEGIATAGANVAVEAGLYGGRDSELRDAVSGSTAGRLTLGQTMGYAQLAPNFIRPPSVGVTRTGLVAENSGGGDLALRIAVRGEQFEPEIADDGDVVLGDVIGRSTAGADVEVSVEATGARIRQEDLDDPARRSRIAGVSNGGDVSVRADFWGVNAGLIALTDEAIIGRPGASVAMDNSIGGETSGHLRLEQNARGGPGTSIVTGGIDGPRPGPGQSIVPGAGGDAYSRLTQSGSFESLTLRSETRAGDGGRGQIGFFGGGIGVEAPGAPGGQATNFIEATNDAGPVVVTGSVLGGEGGTSVSAPGAGGDALIEFRATTYGDDHSILIGHFRPIEIDPVTRRAIRHGAWGGDGTDDPPFLGMPPITSHGGRAESHSQAHAHDDSVVEVYDRARGGGAGQGGGVGLTSVSGIGERGGDAQSTASAIGGGQSSVLASSEALAGGGSGRVAIGGEGGDANSSAFASGLGEVQARSLAIGGGVFVSGTRAGSGYATAEAEGSLAAASAEARTGRGSGASFRAALTRETTTRTRLEAIATYAEGLPAIDPAVSGTAFITGSPLTSDIDLARGRHQELDALLVDRPGATVEAVGQWSARADKRAISTQLVELDITLAPPESEGDLALAIFKVDAVSGGFQSLSFRLEVLGEAFGEEVVFENLAAANTYFAALIGLGEAFRESFSGGDPAVRAIFEVVTREQQRIAFGIAAVVIPEPSTALLLGTGLALFAARRQRASQ